MNIIDLRRHEAHTLIYLKPRSTVLYDYGTANDEVRRYCQGSPLHPGLFLYLAPDIKLVQGTLHLSMRGPSRGAVRNRYSRLIGDSVRALLRRGLVTPTTPTVLWDPVDAACEPAISAAEAAAGLAENAPLVLYHGTSAGRASTILEHGLAPCQEAGVCQWGREIGNDKNVHPWRKEAVYLSASLQQAAVYATRAATNARTRKERGQQAVILRVLVRPSQFDALRPDDDFIVDAFCRETGVLPQAKRFIQHLRAEQQKTEAYAARWRDSLNQYGQVAHIGAIGADQISMMPYRMRHRRAYPAPQQQAVAQAA